MNNMEIYDRSKSVPANALRQIAAGRLKGKSDINPMWRLKMLTEQFGPCGVGWKYTIDRQWIENGEGVEKAAFVNISLYVKVDGQWSDGIPGTGGSAFVTQESKGPYTSDECYKMALTDAISVACKALGFGADVYWEADKTKYNNQQETQLQQKKIVFINNEQLGAMRDIINIVPGYSESDFCAEARIQSLEQLPAERFKGAFNYVQSKAAVAE